MTSESKDGKVRQRAVFGCGFLAILAVVLTVLMMLVGMTAFYDLLKALAIGWISFLMRTLPKIEFNWSIAGMAVFCSVLALAIGHTFCNSIARAAQRSWRWRWTVCSLFGICVLFLVGMAAGGIAHQIGWMAASDEEWIEKDPDRTGFRSAWRQMGMASHFHSIYLSKKYALGNQGSQLDAAIEDFLRISGEESWDYQFYLILDEQDTEQCVGVLTFPRVKQPERVWVGELLLFDGENKRISNEEQLQSTISQYRNRLRTL